MDSPESVASAAAAHARAADVEFLVRRGMFKGYQLLSLLAPPAYLALALARNGRTHLSANRVLRATWLAGLVGAHPRFRSTPR